MLLEDVNDLSRMLVTLGRAIPASAWCPDVANAVASRINEGFAEAMF